MTIQILFLALKFEIGLKYITSKSIKNYSVMVTESLALTQERLIDGPFVFSYIFKSKAVSHRKVQVCDKFCGLNDVAFMCSRPRLNLSLLTLLVMLKHCNTPKIEFIISTVAFNAFAGANSRNNGLNQSSKNPLLDN